MRFAFPQRLRRLSRQTGNLLVNINSRLSIRWELLVWHYRPMPNHLCYLLLNVAGEEVVKRTYGKDWIPPTLYPQLLT